MFFFFSFKFLIQNLCAFVKDLNRLLLFFGILFFLFFGFITIYIYYRSIFSPQTNNKTTQIYVTLSSIALSESSVIYQNEAVKKKENNNKLETMMNRLKTKTKPMHTRYLK